VNALTNEMNHNTFLSFQLCHQITVFRDQQNICPFFLCGLIGEEKILFPSIFLGSWLGNFIRKQKPKEIVNHKYFYTRFDEE
jgi:hypothetical protein